MVAVRALTALSFVLSVCFSTHAQANWSVIGENKELGLVIYSDFKNVKGDSRYPQLITLYNSKAVNREFGHDHLSELELNEYDCRSKKVHLLKFSWHKQSMAQGEIVWSVNHAQPWEGIPAGSVHMTNWIAVCKR